VKRDFNEFKEYIRDKKVGVVGIGVSNLPLIRFLLKLGARVSAFDRRELRDLGPEVQELVDRIEIFLGHDYLDHLDGLDVIFKTPGMRIDDPHLVRAKEKGTVITSEMEEFLKYCKARTFGVTGSDGKTTTTTVLGLLLKEAGYKVFVGGNIGTPLFDKIEDIRHDHMVVLELSSFQLMTMTVSPDVAIVTNLSPNHLDMHKGMQEYIDAKKNIFLHQGKDDILILNEDNEITKKFAGEAKCVVEFFSSTKELEDAYFMDGTLYLRDEKVVELKDMLVKGVHNAENFLAAFLAAKDYVSIDEMRKVALTFPGVKHRCQLVREYKGVRYYNDSIASSPTRTLASLKALDTKVNLIAGGYDKNIDLSPVAFQGYKYIKNAVLVGDTRFKLKEAFDNLANMKGIFVPVHMAESFEDAVYIAKRLSKPGDIVALSPACASFDSFKNFEERGDRFASLVNDF